MQLTKRAVTRENTVFFVVDRRNHLLAKIIPAPLFPHLHTILVTFTFLHLFLEIEKPRGKSQTAIREPTGCSERERRAATPERHKTSQDRVRDGKRGKVEQSATRTSHNTQ